MFNKIKEKLQNLGFYLSIDHEIDDDYVIVDETFNYIRKTTQDAFTDYHFIIHIEYPLSYPYFKVLWDIVFLHNKKDYEERYYLSNIHKRYPEFINQGIIDLLNKIPFYQEVESLNFDELEYLVKELEHITYCLNQKIFTHYRLSNH